jgi:hypothetical protein
MMETVLELIMPKMELKEKLLLGGLSDQTSQTLQSLLGSVKHPHVPRLARTLSRCA